MFRKVVIHRVVLIVAVALAASAPAASVSAGTNFWTGNGPQGGSIHALAFDPTAPSTVYAASELGVYKSANGGGNWYRASTGLTTAYIQALAIDPATPATVYAGTAYAGVFKSTNGGWSWSPASNGLPVGSFTLVALLIDPAAAGTLYF